MINKNALRLVLGLFIGQLLFACEQDIEIEIKDDTPKIVLNGWLRSGEVPTIRLNESLGVLSNSENPPISNAEVQLYENEELIGLMVMDEAGKYVMPSFIVKAGSSYQVKVTAANFPDVEAEVEVPYKLDDENTNINYTTIYAAGSDSTVVERGQIDISLKDETAESSYFLLSMLYVDEYYDAAFSEDTTVNRNLTNPPLSKDPLFQQIYVSGGAYLSFSDSYFSEASYEANLYSDYDLRGYEYQDEFEYYSEYYLIKVEQVSKGLYQYLLSLEDNQYPEAFTEPTQVFSNVSGGYGILGASSDIEYKIEEKRN